MLQIFSELYAISILHRTSLFLKTRREGYNLDFSPPSIVDRLEETLVAARRAYAKGLPRRAAKHAREALILAIKARRYLEGLEAASILMEAAISTDIDARDVVRSYAMTRKLYKHARREEARRADELYASILRSFLLYSLGEALSGSELVGAVVDEVASKALSLASRLREDDRLRTIVLAGQARALMAMRWGELKRARSILEKLERIIDSEGDVLGGEEVEFAALVQDELADIALREGVIEEALARYKAAAEMRVNRSAPVEAASSMVGALICMVLKADEPGDFERVLESEIAGVSLGEAIDELAEAGLWLREAQARMVRLACLIALGRDEDAVMDAREGLEESMEVGSEYLSAMYIASLSYANILAGGSSGSLRGLNLASSMLSRLDEGATLILSALTSLSTYYMGEVSASRLRTELSYIARRLRYLDYGYREVVVREVEEALSRISQERLMRLRGVKLLVVI